MAKINRMTVEVLEEKVDYAVLCQRVIYETPIADAWGDVPVEVPVVSVEGKLTPVVQETVALKYY